MVGEYVTALFVALFCYDGWDMMSTTKACPAALYLLIPLLGWVSLLAIWETNPRPSSRHQLCYVHSHDRFRLDEHRIIHRSVDKRYQKLKGGCCGKNHWVQVYKWDLHPPNSGQAFGSPAFEPLGALAYLLVASLSCLGLSTRTYLQQETGRCRP